MPLYKPKFLNPNAIMGNATVNIEEPFSPTCVIDGNVGISAYQIDIKTLSDDGRCLEVYDSIESQNGMQVGDLSNAHSFSITDNKKIELSKMPDIPKPISSYPIYAYQVSDNGTVVQNITYVEMTVNEDGDLIAKNSSDTIFTYWTNCYLVYLYESKKMLYSTEKINLEETFYPSTSSGKYNTFILPKKDEIDLTTVPNMFQTSEIIMCKNDGELEVKKYIYNETEINIWCIDDIRHNNYDSYYQKFAKIDGEVDSGKIVKGTKIVVGKTYFVQYNAAINISSNNKRDAYTYRFHFWDSQNKSDIPSVTSNYAVFYPITPPNVLITDEDKNSLENNIEITSREYVFNVKYEDMNSSLKWYGWKLSSSGEIIEDTISSNHIYGVAGNISYYYGGFINGRQYRLQFRIVTQNDYVIDKYIDINVKYQTEELSTLFTVEEIGSEQGILCDWSDFKVSSGISTSDIIYYDNFPKPDSTSINIRPKTEIVFEKNQVGNFKISKNALISMSFQVNPLYRYDKDIIVRLHGKNDDSDVVAELLIDKIADGIYFPRLIVYKDGTQILDSGSNIITLNEGIKDFCADRWCFITMSGNEVRLDLYKPNKVIYPSEGVFPSEELFPNYSDFSYVDSYKIIDFDYLSKVPEVVFDSLTIGGINNIGELNFDYIYATRDEIPDGLNTQNNFVTDKILNESNMKFEFFATFENNLNAGNTIIESLSSFDIFRQRSGQQHREYVSTVSINSKNKFLVDYMAANNYMYTYFLQPKTSNEIVSLVSSEEIKPKWDSYALLVVDESEVENVFYLNKMFMFELNLNVGDLSNNTDVVVTKTFTKYPLVQRSPSNYWTGSLTSLMGFIDCSSGNYKQEPQMLDELKSLTTDTRRKFLKDVDGHIYEVQIADALSVSVENDLKTATIKWVEVGDAKGCSVVNNPDLSSITWLLTNNGIPSPYMNYVWDDNATWDDNKYWTGNYGVLDINE